MTATLGSFKETQEILAEQGCRLDIKTIRRVAYRAAGRVRLMQQMGNYGFSKQDSLAGRRVAISSDGGRLRLREKKRGPKTAKGRTRYNGAWREPKLFIIYAVDENGKQRKDYPPLIDGGMQDPDTLFALLQNYLDQMDIQQADQILLVSDGARWIWNRLPSLVKNLGLDVQRIFFLVDFYHAVQHLHDVAALRKNWSAKARKRWCNKQRKLLYQGKIDQVIQAIRSLCRGRNSKSIRTELRYFIKHRTHMAYDVLLNSKLPIGSGAIESAIRRVVNLRLKGPSIFWNKQNADALLLLRAYYKSGRWNQLKSLAFSPSVALAP